MISWETYEKILRTVFVIFIVSMAVQGIDNYLNIGGKLLDSFGYSLTGTHNLTFRIYNHSASGTLLWEENHTDSDAVTLDSEGYFTVSLGSLRGLNLSFNENYWVEIVVDGETLTPRHRIGSSGYSFRAQKARDIECPNDMINAGSFCIDKNITSTTGDWDSGVYHCLSNGKRLCNYPELLFVMNDSFGIVQQLNDACHNITFFDTSYGMGLTSSTMDNSCILLGRFSADIQNIVEEKDVRHRCCLGG